MVQPDSPETVAGAPAPPQQFRRSNLSGQLLLVGVATALVVIAIYYVEDQRAASPSPARPADRITLLERRLASDEAQIARLERTAPQASAVSSLSARIGAVEKTQKTIVAGTPASDLAEHLGSFALKTDEDALAARVTKLEDQNSSVALESAAASLALANLTHASGTGEDFSQPLHALIPLMPDAPQIADLMRYAKGAPTETALAARFPQAAGEALAAERRAHATSWLERLWANLASMVSIRRVGAGEGVDTESRLARASDRLHAGDLAGAINEVHAIGGAAGDVLAPWLADARARLAIDRDETALGDRLVAELTQRSGRTP